jgi:hypothetical protein
MKSVMVVASVVFMCMGCFERNRIDFVYFNLSTSEIVVNEIAGLPVWASPGVLVPVHTEDRLSEKSTTTFGETIRISPLLKITWQEGGKPHGSELKRDEVGIRAKINKGTIRFTYLGSDKWRVKVSEESK